MVRKPSIVVFLFFCTLYSSTAQNILTDTIANPSKQEIIVDHADLFELQKLDTSVVQKLTGHVELRQDTVYMYCDSARIRNRTDLNANGNVIIQQNDTLNIFSDSLIYDGITRLADLYSDVILENGEQKLFTDLLNYDLNTKIATYFNGATLTNGSSQLTSKKGYYYVVENTAYFKDSVIVVDPNFSLKADTLKFNTETKIVEFLGPTLIKNDTIKVYCEGGFYDTENNVAEFTNNAQFQKVDQKAQADIIRYDGAKQQYLLVGNAKFSEGNQIAIADTIKHNEVSDQTFLIGNAKFTDGAQKIDSEEIIYDANTDTYSTRGRSVINDPPQILEADQIDYSDISGLGIAKGNVVWQDTSAKISILCDHADYNQSTNYLKASGGNNGRPLFIALVEDDSMFMSADTLLSTKVDSLSSDSSRLLIGYYDVRIYKSNLQAISDSLVYNTQDSLFYFYDDPIMWSDTSQFSADTMQMQLSNNTIDRIYLKEKGLIVNSPDEIYFNQIQGKEITAYFKDENLRKMLIEGNAESVYYALDEGGAYIGVNKIICSEMTIFFGNNEIEELKFFESPNGSMVPMREANHEEVKLKRFYWATEKRPMSVDDLFVKKTSPAVEPNDTELEPSNKK